MFPTARSILLESESEHVESVLVARLARIDSPFDLFATRQQTRRERLLADRASASFTEQIFTATGETESSAERRKLGAIDGVTIGNLLTLQVGYIYII